MRFSERIRRWLHQPITLRAVRRCAACDQVLTPTGSPFISGPSVYLCQPCATEALIRVAQVRPGTSVAYAGEHPSARCSFCGRKASDARGILGLFAAAICRDCLELCAEVFATVPS
jgi:ClpX C4-type zinc finger protein